MLIRFLSALLAVLMGAGAAFGEPSASLIYFTDTGREDGRALLPGFKVDSVWSGLGQSKDGRVYIALSNHQKPGGNVAIFRLDPGARAMTLVGDLRAVSEAAGNWQEGENQHKVHTFLMEHGDGMIYFATMPSDEPQSERGGHLYRLDPMSDVITDISAKMPGGIYAKGQGLRGMTLNQARVGELFVQLHDRGDIERFDIPTLARSKIGVSAVNSYVMHADAWGDLYYLGGASLEQPEFLRWSDGATQSLLRLEQTDWIGMISPLGDGERVAVLLSKSKAVYVLDTASEQISTSFVACGVNWWQLFNMVASEDGRSLYYVSNNNDHSKIWKQDLASGTCEEVLDVKDLLGTRNLAFGGQNIWQGNSFLTPVWTYEGNDDTAILRVTLD